MARGKKVKTGGKARGSPRQAQPSYGRSPKSPRAHAYDGDRDTTVFTLRDAARTEHTGSFWSSNLNLRHRSIGFVRSNDPVPAEESATLEDGKPTTTTTTTTRDTPRDSQPCSPSSPLSPASEVSDSIIHDFHDQPHVPGLLRDAVDASARRAEQMPIRSSSPTLSGSSEEIVLFKGRAAAAQPPVKDKPSTSAHSKLVAAPAVESSMLSTQSWLPNTVSMTPSAPSALYHTLQQTVDESQPPLRFKDPLRSVRKSPDFIALAPKEVPRKKDRRKRERALDLQDEIMDDYLANMRENGELDGLDATESSSKVDQDDLDGWASSDIRDFDELSTSDEILGVVQHVLAKRQRPHGLQYLIVWEGYTIDDARWVPHASLTMDGAATMIESFEEEEKHIAELTPGSDDSEDNDANFSDVGDDDDDDDDDNEDDDEDFDDDRDLIERRAARLSDEKLARILAKQEDLGLGSDELLLFDEMFADEGEGDGESDAELRMALAMSRSRRKPKKGRFDFLRGFDDIVLDAEEHQDFDVMDHDRPSLVQRNGKHGDPMTWGLSDSEQAEGLRSAWAADRKKKKARKQEREELRAQGLLGKKNKFKPDLRARYNEGMDIDQFGMELQEFLFGIYESRALPPMDKRDRKTVHEIASMFGLKSMSKGSGRSRFPVLQKTSKTIPFDEFLFQRASSKLTRKFYPRMDMKGKGGAGPSRKRAGGGGGGGGIVRADTSYREGEIVGGTAPELGSDNRGRAMLEKMGWTSGNALGALDNKGILQPIAHVIRNSRAGLG